MCAHVNARVCLCAAAHMWRSEFFSFHHVGSKVQTKVTGFVNVPLQPLSNLLAFICHLNDRTLRYMADIDFPLFYKLIILLITFFVLLWRSFLITYGTSC